MTEQEWLTSDDPGAMVRWLTAGTFYRCAVCGSLWEVQSNGHYKLATGEVFSDCCRTDRHLHLKKNDLPGRRASDRKLRLFACACVRRLWHLLGPNCRRAVIELEAQADGEPVRFGHMSLALDELEEHNREGSRALRGGAYPSPPGRARWNATAAVGHLAETNLAGWMEPNKGATFLFCLFRAGQCDAGLDPGRESVDGYAKLPAEAAILRCVKGNPFRPASWACGCGRGVAVRDWRHFWRCDSCGEMQPHLAAAGELIKRLALAACDGRADGGGLDPVALLALADALEDAGCPVNVCERNHGHKRTRCEHTICAECEAPTIPHPLLGHLRSPGPHVRGCHVVDLILGRE